VPGILAGALALVTLFLVAADGHPAGLLTAVAGAAVPVVLWGAWRLSPSARIHRSAADHRGSDQIVARRNEANLPEEPIADRERTTERSARLSTGPSRTRSASTDDLDTDDAAPHVSYRLRTERNQLAHDAPLGERATAIMAEVLAFNGSSQAHEDLWSDTRQATDIVNRAADSVTATETEVGEAELAYRAERAKQPDRNAPRLRQWLLAGAALALDGVACVFAAEALDGSQLATYGWAGLFVALLAAGELALDHYRDMHRVLWRWIAGILGAFIGLLGVLRFVFLAPVGSGGDLAALVAATLFSIATAGFFVAGYRLLRVAETRQAWHARRLLRDCERFAAAARRELGAADARRDRLASAYLSGIRSQLARNYSASELPPMEQALMAHLTGQDLAR
jgi:hypothetical protein